MEPSVTGPTGDLCAGTAYDLTSQGCEAAASVRWVVVTTPAAVSADEVVFASQEALNTTVTVPIEGEYSFSIQCCDVVLVPEVPEVPEAVI